MKISSIKKRQHVSRSYSDVKKHPGYEEIKKQLLSGCYNPLVLDGNYLIDGLFRLEVAKSLGMTDVETVQVGKWTGE